jgi:anti-anti-sigma factor
MATPCLGFEVTRLHDALTAQTPKELGSQFSSIAKNGRLRHVLDLTGSDPYRSETAAAMISILRSVRQFGGEVRLIAADRVMKRMLGVTGLDHIFPVFESADLACRG